MMILSGLEEYEPVSSVGEVYFVGSYRAYLIYDGKIHQSKDRDNRPVKLQYQVCGEY